MTQKFMKKKELKKNLQNLVIFPVIYIQMHLLQHLGLILIVLMIAKLA